jgi:hypothetical protein
MSLLSGAAVDQGIALPPPRLRYKVAGTEDGDWFAHSGRMSVADLSRALAAIGRSFCVTCRRRPLPVASTVSTSTRKQFPG